jgi:HAD superfamily hydrolase (TIGR01509 family)
MHPLPPRRPPARAAAVFDCDGLLVGTSGVWDRAYAALAARYGAVIQPAARRQLASLPLAGLGRALAALLGHPAPPGQLGQEIYDMVASNLGAGHAPMPGAVELVTALHGTRPLAVASGTPAQIVISYLRPHGLLDAFDVVLGGGDAPRPKPAPDIYLRACQQLAADPAASIALEDSATGATSARAAGLYLIGVPSAPGHAFPADLLATSLAEPAVWHALGLPGRAAA